MPGRAGQCLGLLRPEAAHPDGRPSRASRAPGYRRWEPAGFYLHDLSVQYRPCGLWPDGSDARRLRAYYKLLGDEVTTEITYRLPGLRVEHIKGDRHVALGLTAITPITETETEVHQCLYWTLPWLGAARPLFQRLARVFLKQDRDVVVKQQEGLAYDPGLMLIDDADTQAKWYHRLKTEWLRAEEEGRPFVNPIAPQTLRWRS